jgi:hypothetical protein
MNEYVTTTTVRSVVRACGKLFGLRKSNSAVQERDIFQSGPLASSDGQRHGLDLKAAAAVLGTGKRVELEWPLLD